MGSLLTSESSIELSLEDIEIGYKKEFSIIVSNSLVEQFAEISGDYNPLHMNEKFAKTTEFNQRVCHGMLLASFFSRLVGMYIPGKNALFLAQSLKFISPCYIGDEITIKGEVIEKSTATRIITLKTTIEKDSQIIVEGQSKVMVRE